MIGSGQGASIGLSEKIRGNHVSAVLLLKASREPPHRGGYPERHARAKRDLHPTAVPTSTPTSTEPTATSTPSTSDQTPTATISVTPSEPPTESATSTETVTVTPTATQAPPLSPYDAAFYDGDGNRVLSIVNGVTTVYLGDYYEYEVATGITRSYYGSGSAMRITGASDPEANGVFYLLKDHLGSTNLILDSSGNVTSEMRYKAWGETRFASGTAPTTFAYTGQRQEPDLGFYYYKARWYDPALGRFMQADTVIPTSGNPISLDRCAYASDNPLKRIDPNGHCDTSFIPNPTQPAEFAKTFINSIIRPLGFIESCIDDVEMAIDAYKAGERRPLVLYSHATGITDAIVSLAEKFEQLNADTEKVFSDSPFLERVLPSMHVGLFATTTAAFIVGVGQAAIRSINSLRSPNFETLRLQSLANQAVEEITALGDRAYSRPQLRAMENYPNMRPLFRGWVIHDRFTTLLRADPELSYLEVAKPFQMMPDVRNPISGTWWDLTTAGDWMKHLLKYTGIYGSDGILIPYQ